MNSFNLNNKIRFMLSDDYIHETMSTEDGSLMTAIRADEKKDDEGNVYYGFDARASFFEHSPDEFEEGFARDRILDAFMARLDTAKYFVINDKPKVHLVNKKLSVTVFGVHMNYYSFMCIIQIDWSILTVTVSKRNEGDPNDLIRVLDRLIEVVNSIRISGRKVPIASFEISDAFHALDYDTDTLYGIEDVTGEVIQRTKNDSSGTGFRKSESASNNAYEGIPNPSESTGFSVSPTGVLNKYTGTSKSKMILPKGIKRVGAGVFGWSYGLKSVIIPEGVTRIDKGAFSHCSFLKSVSFPSTLQAIGEGAFSNTALQDVRFPASLRSIGMSAFSECTSLKTIEFAEGITKIENGAFSKTGLLSVSLPTSLKVLDAFAFSDCEKLKEVVLLGKVDKIECLTFARCKELESLVISEGTKTIASSALAETKQLKDVFLPASVQRIMLSDNDADKSTVFHVPQGSNAEKWCIDQQRKYDNQSYEELVANRIMEQTYSDAMIRMEKGEYSAAKKAFASIPKFRDSAKQVQLCDEKAREQKLERAYSNAKQLMEQEDYAAAKEKFLTLMGYKDSEELVLVCESKHREQQKAREYAKAKEFMDQGDFVRAKETFLTITEYKDSEELVLVCETKHREQQKEIEYQRLVKLEYSAKTPEDWEKLAEEFENLEYNRAASLHADRCRRKAEEVRGQLEEQRIAAQRARERAERRQQLLDERKQLELTLEQYKGLGSLFGEKAKIRKAALARLKEIEDELSKVD